MKILMLSHYFWPHRGGVEKHLENLSLELLKRGHSITVVTEQHEVNLPLQEVHKGITVIRIPFYARDSKRMTWTWMCEHDYLFDQADLVHVHDVFWWYWPIRFTRLFKPVYITFHGYECSTPSIKAKIQRKCSEIFSIGTICIGDYIKKWYWANPLLVSYGASELKPKFNITKNTDAVFIGRLDPDTGLDQYVSTIKKLKNIGMFNIYGEGLLMKGLLDISKKDRRVKVFSWTNEPWKAIAKNRFVFSSQYLSILEAMQMKRLVAAVYNNEIKRDYLMCHPMRDNMIIAGTADELADKMNDIITHPERERQMIENAYQWAKEQTWEKLADQYEALWAR